MNDSDFDKKFDDGEDVTSLLELANARRPGLGQKRVKVDFPLWMVEALDKEAHRLGVTRQSLIKLWLADKSSDIKTTYYNGQYVDINQSYQIVYAAYVPDIE